LFALFFAITRSTPRSATLALAGLSIAGAVLAKSSAGLIPGAGVAAYLLFTRRLLAMGQDFAGVPNCAAVRPNDYR